MVATNAGHVAATLVFFNRSLTFRALMSPYFDRPVFVHFLLGFLTSLFGMPRSLASKAYLSFAFTARCSL